MLNSFIERINLSRPILVFGRDGQVGRALQTYLKDLMVKVVFLGRSDCDLASESSIVEVLNQYRPQVIINAAAYTSVDKAEIEQNLAFAINTKAPELMARYIASVKHGVFVHYSTDYVFADSRQDAYLETDSAGPAEHLNAYGQSKLMGEQAIEDVFNLVRDSENPDCIDEFCRYFILRTSWVYGDGINFIRAILHLSRENDELKVVKDQVGAPTSAKWLAQVGVQMAASQVESGIYHAVPDGELSRHSLAVFVIKIAASCGYGAKVKSKNILPVLAEYYAMSAKRVYNSRLNNAKLKKAMLEIAPSSQYPHWQEQVEAYVREYVLKSLKS